MLWLNILAKIVKAFRSGDSPRQIAAGFVLGFLIGLMPFWTLQGVVLLLLLLFLNVSLAAGGLAFLLASGFAYLLDPWFHGLGFWLLTLPALQSAWEWLYNTPVGALSRFNTTVVMGSLFAGLVLAVPLYFLMKHGVVVYREKMEPRVQQWKLVQMLRGSKLVQWYLRARDLGGA